MELTNTFRVDVPVEDAWEVLTDVERIAPCLPGAQLTEIEGDEYRGVVKVKVGPITAQYRGAARFVERDDVAHRAVLAAEGRDTRGQGNASATITAQLTPDGDATVVEVATDLHITGKVAQFGRGVMADVSAKLLAQFVEQLEATVLEAEAEIETEVALAAAEVAATHAERAFELAEEAEAHARVADAIGGVRRIDSDDTEPVDLLDAAGGPVAKRAAPLAVVGLLVLVILLLWRRRSRRS